MGQWGNTSACPRLRNRFDDAAIETRVPIAPLPIAPLPHCPINKMNLGSAYASIRSTDLS